MTTDVASTLTWEQTETVRLLKNAPGTKYQDGSDTDKKIIRDWVRSILQSGPANVEFVKSDNSLRKMKCTLNWNLIPEDKMPKSPVETPEVSDSRQQKVASDETLRVFDLDVAEWRSFRFDRLHSVSATIEFV